MKMTYSHLKDVLYPIKVFYGPMFSKKSTNLLKMYIDSKEPKMIISHTFDTRCDSDVINTHDGDYVKGIKVKSIYEILDMKDYKKAKEVYIDESQFFGKKLYNFISKERFKKKFILAGLDLDSDLNQFGSLLDIIKLKNVISHRMPSKCYICNSKAFYTLCVVKKNGQILSGSSEYKPCCKVHHK